MKSDKTNALVSAAFDAAVTRGLREASQEFAAAVARMEGEKSPLEQAIAALAAASTHVLAARYEEALLTILPELDVLETSEFGRQLGWLYSNIGFSFGMLGNPEHGLEWSARAIGQLDLGRKSIERYTVFGNHGSLLGMLKDFDQSREAHETALKVAVAARNACFQYVCHFNIAYSFLMQALDSSVTDIKDRPTYAQEALRRGEQARQMFVFCAPSHDAAGLFTLLGHANLALQNVKSAMDLFSQALAAGAHNQTFLVEALLGLATAGRLTREFDAARSNLWKANDLANQMRYEMIMDRIHEEGVALETAAGNPVEALAWANRRCRFLTLNYQQRLRTQARVAEILAEANRNRPAELQYRAEADALRKRSRMREQLDA